MLFDSHTHLNFEEFTEDERAELAKEIAESEVAYLVDVGDSVESSKQAIKDAEDYPWCFAAVGIHPEHASGFSDKDIAEIKKMAAHKKAVAIGEIGLDFHHGKENMDDQVKLFREQIRLANELKMPIMVHSRDADQMTMEILKEENAFSDERKAWFPKRPGPDGEKITDARVQIHCYSGSAEFAEEYIKLGATLSLGGPVTFKNGKKAVEVIKKIPIEFIMSETDAPFLTPEPLRGNMNKSQYIEHIVRRMGLIKGLSYEEISKTLTENAKRFFGIK